MTRIAKDRGCFSGLTTRTPSPFCWIPWIRYPVWEFPLGFVGKAGHRKEGVTRGMLAGRLTGSVKRGRTQCEPTISLRLTVLDLRAVEVATADREVLLAVGEEDSYIKLSVLRWETGVGKKWARLKLL